MSLKFKAKQMGIYHTSTPVFNKRLFKAQAGIVLTEEILKILNRPHDQERSKAELYKLKSVVNGLKDVHKGFQFIKDALGIVLCYEKIEANVNVKKQPTEKGLSCYYILTGSIEATYDINDSDSDEERKVIGFAGLRGESKNNKIHKGDGTYIISYTHVAGDYLGLVSGEGPEYDLPPPKSIKTLETCEFLRIDRGKFHHAVRVVHNQYVQEVEHFINSESILRHLPEKEREKLVPLMAKQDYAAGKVIVNQGEVPDHIFFIGKGRCQFFRRVFIKEAHRVELVKLGQIEKGEVFGESSLLDGSPCFCSVTSIGQVTCFLINKWVIKTNENVLNLLRQHEHIFYEDDIIQHYIRDSDIWQSYKRSQVIELLKSMNKQFISIKNQDIEEILERSLEFGDAKRSLSSRTSTQRKVGEPEHNQPLFVVPRSRRPSSAILHSNATAVVKAVLLLRRKNGESDIELPPLQSKPQRIKPVSAPCGYRSTNNHRSQQQISIENGNQHRPKTTSHARKRTRNSQLDRGKNKNGLRSEFQGPQHSSCQNGKMRNKSTNKEGVVTPCREVECQVRGTNDKSTDSPDSKKVNGMANVAEKSKDATRVEKYFLPSKNFIIKEIINTGNPKRKTSPYRYQRFDKSMFSILDGGDNEEANRKSGPSPWRVSFAASKWMAGIRRKRLEAAAEKSRNVTPSPTPPPLIVIEEYAPQHGLTDELSSDNSSDETFNTKKSLAKPLRTPTPSLEQLDEENDDDINEYNKHEAGKPIEEKWYTPIHKARDESRVFLKQLHVDVEELKKHRSKNLHAAPDEGAKMLSEDFSNAYEKEPDDRKKIEVDKRENNTTSTSISTTHRIRRHSLRSTSTFGTMEGRTILSSRSRKSARMERNNMHNSSGKSKNLLIFDKKNAELSQTGTPPKTRHERRRLLLLNKIAVS